jgi:hypothetical protein
MVIFSGLKLLLQQLIVSPEQLQLMLLEIFTSAEVLMALSLASQPPPPCEEPEESLLVIYNAVSPNGNGMNEISTI